MSVAVGHESRPTVDVDPFSIGYLNDPYPEHERMRRAGPVVRFKNYDAASHALRSLSIGRPGNWDPLKKSMERYLLSDRGPRL